jgi:predicted MPP superfamily phosphohydrolase
VGMRSAISRPVSPVSVLAQAPSGACRIALWHEPDRAPEVQRGGASLLLCGHTHGGQLALPGLGPLRLPVLGQRYPGGLYWLGPMPLYVTRGLGVLPPRLRFCCPPEVTLLTLRRAA